MADNSLHQEMIDFGLSTLGASERALVGLTLLYHPNVARVGQVTPLFSLNAGGTRRVSRLEPKFYWHGEDHGEPLASPVLSRKPIVIRATEQGGIAVENEGGLANVLVQGDALNEGREFGADALSRGIVIALSGAVILLLHWLAADRDPRPDLGIFGESLEIRRVREEVLRIADLDACVLIRGESGSGKELVASAIHRQSRRQAQRYVTVNMGAIPPSVGASMLFGHVRGAFTGAANPSPGFFGSADGGTLFLDEVGETPRELQSLLLRAVREGEIQPVGEARARQVDVRVLSATDADLNAMVERGQFAMPLLRRLEGYTIAVPPLRERRDDLARLFFKFLNRELEETGERRKLDEPEPSRKPWLPAFVVLGMLDYHWPGNVAELQTITKRLAIINRERDSFHLDPMLADRLLPSALAARATSAPSSVPSPAPSSVSPAAAAASPTARSAPTWPPVARHRDPASIEEAEIVQVMRDHAFKINAAAVALGVSRSWLHTRLESCQGIRQAKELNREEILCAVRAVGADPAALSERLEVSEHGLKLRLKALELGDLARAAALGKDSC